MATLNPYLNFPGNTEEAFNFYKSVFGGEFTEFQRFGETPGCEEFSAEDKHKIMHICLPVLNGPLLLGNDVLASLGHTFIAGNNVHLTIMTDSKEQTDYLFHALSESGVVDMELQDTFWGAYFGSFTDKFGITWMINYQY